MGLGDIPRRSTVAVFKTKLLHLYHPQRDILLILGAAERGVRTPCATSSDLSTFPLSVFTHSARYRPAAASSIKIDLLAAVQVDGIRLTAVSQHERGPAGRYAAFYDRSIRLHADEIEALHEVLSIRSCFRMAAISRGVLVPWFVCPLGMFDGKRVIQIVIYRPASRRSVHPQRR